MPDFRITLTVGALRPGIAPETVLPRIADAGAELTLIEASELTIVSGSPRLVVRFEAADDPAAARLARHMLTAAAAIIEVRRSVLTRRIGGRWLPLRA